MDGFNKAGGLGGAAPPHFKQMVRTTIPYPYCKHGDDMMLVGKHVWPYKKWRGWAGAPPICKQNDPHNAHCKHGETRSFPVSMDGFNKAGGTKQGVGGGAAPRSAEQSRTASMMRT